MRVLLMFFFFFGDINQLYQFIDNSHPGNKMHVIVIFFLVLFLSCIHVEIIIIIIIVSPTYIFLFTETKHEFYYRDILFFQKSHFSW